ncbi:hypothetical protein ACFVZ3_39105 [Kitasatospora purpeofusca]|uniref:hypothetical protein n=1 Tax=Kitasatospora TaxID=2063 RepID=UPI0035E14F07
MQFVKGLTGLVAAAASFAVLPWWGFLVVVVLAIVVLGGSQVITTIWPSESADRKVLIEQWQINYHDRWRRRTDRRERRWRQRRAGKELDRNHRRRNGPSSGGPVP